MSSDEKSLEEKIAVLERTVETLTARCDSLQWQIVRMAISKISDPRYPYWNWLLSRALADEDRLRLSAVLSALDARIAGMNTPDELTKDIEGVSYETLYGSGHPSMEEVFAAIKSVTSMEDDGDVVDLIQAVNDQGMFPGLCEYVLSAAEREGGPSQA